MAELSHCLSKPHESLRDQEARCYTSQVTTVHMHLSTFLCRCCEHGMFYDAGCLIEMLRRLRLSGKRWNEVSL